MESTDERAGRVYKSVASVVFTTTIGKEYVTLIINVLLPGSLVLTRSSQMCE